MISFFNIMIRGLSLSSRLGLTLFMARFMDLGIVGLFGLLYSATLTLPAIIGFGLNYRATRDIVEQPPAKAIVLTRDRLVVSLVILAILLPLAAMLWGTLGFPQPEDKIAMLAVLGLEVLAFDIHMMLIAMRRSLLANFLIFVRTAAWVFPFAFLAYFYPPLRTIEFLLYAWLCSLIAVFAILAFVFRRDIFSSRFIAPVDVGWLRGHLSNGWLIYVSDLSIVGASYSDRYIIGYSLGLTDVGIFVFFWSLANGVQLLVNTGVVQVRLPDIVESARSKSPAVFIHEIAIQIRSVLISSAVISLFVFVCTELLIPFLKRTELQGHQILLATLLLTTALRSCSDVLKSGLFAKRMDTHWVAVNIASLIANSLATFAALRLGGLGYVGVALATCEAIMLLARYRLLRRSLGS